MSLYPLRFFKSDPTFNNSTLDVPSLSGEQYSSSNVRPQSPPPSVTIQEPSSQVALALWLVALASVQP